MAANELSLTWPEFIEQCAAACAEGLSEREFGKQLVGKVVQWSGTIEWINVNKGTIIPGLRVRMQPVRVPLPNGRVFVGRSVALELTPGAELERARAMHVGDPIAFSGAFSAHGVFPNVTFTPDDEKNEVVLTTGLEQGRLTGS